MTEKRVPAAPATCVPDFVFPGLPEAIRLPQGVMGRPSLVCRSPSAGHLVPVT